MVKLAGVTGNGAAGGSRWWVTVSLAAPGQRGAPWRVNVHVPTQLAVARLGRLRLATLPPVAGLAARKFRAGFVEDQAGLSGGGRSTRPRAILARITWSGRSA